MVGERSRAGSFGFLALTGGLIEVEDFDLDTAPTGLDAGDVGKVWKVAAAPAAEDTWDTAGAGGMLARWGEGLDWQYLDPADAGVNGLVCVKVKPTATAFPGALLGYSRVEDDWWVEGAYFSATPYWTGRYSVDGSMKQMAMGLDLGALPNNTTKNVAHGIADMFISAADTDYLDSPRILDAWFIFANEAYRLGSSIPAITNAIKIGATNVTLITNADLSAGRAACVIAWFPDPAA